MVVSRPGRSSSAFVPVAAVTGLVLGHVLAYVAVFPQAHARRSILAATGHGYWGIAAALAIAGAFISLAETLVRGLRRGARRGAPASALDRYRSTATRLAAFQCVAFVVQETVERAVESAPVIGLLHDGFVAVGIVVQILVAACIALLLTAFGVAAEAVGRALFGPSGAFAAPRAFERPVGTLARSAARDAAERTRAPPRAVSPAG